MPLQRCDRCTVVLPDGPHVMTYDFYTKFREAICFDCYSVIMDKRKKAILDALAKDNYIYAHLGRARKLGLEATLTLEQWNITKEHFDFHCAYCQEGPLECLEHFVPLSLGLGTTWDNSVPSCEMCNRKKRNHHPAIVRTIPSKDIERVRQYLMSLKTGQK